MARLLGKVAVITGAGSGIGRASAALFAREGAVVVMADVKGDAVEAAAAEIAAAGIAGGRAEPVVADVSTEADVRALIDGAVARHGRLDILYNNAGGATGRDGKVTEMPRAEFWRTMQVDLFGTFHGCPLPIPHTKSAEHRGGKES